MKPHLRGKLQVSAWIDAEALRRFKAAAAASPVNQRDAIGEALEIWTELEELFVDRKWVTGERSPITMDDLVAVGEVIEHVRRKRMGQPLK